MARVHGALGLVLLVLVPLASIVLDSGVFAWTMYSGTSEYWLDIRVHDAHGTTRSVAPTGLADASSRGATAVLVGSDHFRRGPSLGVLRAHLDDLALFACRERSGVSADVVLHERRDADAAERETHAHADCR